jgi:glycine cleavage system H protein
MDFPKEMKYTKEHEWVKVEGDIATFGITDYAQNHLGDVVFVELPAVGSEFKAHEAFSAVESVKAASDIYAPIELEDHPELLNQSPYDKGWLVKVKLSQAGEAEQLMDAGGYAEFVETEEE